MAEVSESVALRNVRTRPAEEVAWRFPFADMVPVAASFFDAESRTELQYVPIAAGGGRAVGSWIESRSFVDGPRYFVRIAPGNVQVYRTDLAKSEAARARIAESRAKAALMMEALDNARRSTPMAFDDRPAGGYRDKSDRVLDGGIRAWSPKSRRRLVQTIGQLDLAPIVGAKYPPALVTLTLPGDWLAVASDNEAANRIVLRFFKKWERRWNSPIRCIWKREFQRRGAPHWHLWIAPPADFREFAPWLSAAWTDSLGLDLTTAHGRAEHRNSLLAGSGIDYARAADARDPERLAKYFLKETLGGEEKAYQNEGPSEWAGKSLGRFWGYRGLEKVTAEVALDLDHGVRVWRALRRERASQVAPARDSAGEKIPGLTTRRAVIQARRVLRCTRGHEHAKRCFRVQRRRAVAPPAAGWVVAADGPGLAIRMAQLIAAPAAGRFGWVDGPSLARQMLEARYVLGG